VSNLTVRAIAGVLFSAAVVASFMLGPWFAGFLFLFFSVIGVHELYKLSSHLGGYKPSEFAGIVIGSLIHLITLFVIFENGSSSLFWILLPLFILLLAADLIILNPKALINIAITSFGWCYVSIPFALIVALSMITGQYSYELPIGFFLILWANDTGAYLTGKAFGKRKLYLSVSPNKTWEGLFGGVLLSILVGWGLSEIFDVLEPKHWIMIGLIVAVFGNIGDLFESHLKRTSGVKDSGTIIPGHGGVLDRFDGMLFSLPIVWVYLQFIFAQF